MTDHAQIVIIGGGIVGCSIAYHLAKNGHTDILLLEKGELTSGSTWHAAGLVGQLRSSRNVTRMLKYSVELYKSLEKETGQTTGWEEVGGLRIASSQARWMELKKGATTARSFGMEMHLLTPQEALDLFPILNPEGVVGAAFLPTDGAVDPSGVTQALAKGARSMGVIFALNERVLGIEVKNGRAEKITTNKRVISAEIVVNAAGLWARELGRLSGVNVPLIAVQHQYLITEPIPGLPSKLPTMRDPDKLVYYKEELGALVMGGYEFDPIPWSIQGVPKDFGQELLPSDYEHFESLSDNAMICTPILEQAGIRKLINGPEAFTPDGHFIMGLAPELKNYYVAAGFNAHGIAAAGGVGRMLADWITHGEPEFDLWPVDILRFGSHHQSLRYVRDRTLEAYGKHYTLSWPNDSYQSGRGLRNSPLYEKLKSQHAVYTEKFGWERPNWFASPGMEPIEEKSYGHGNWFDAVARECKAIRETVALIDQTSFSKIEVTGPGSMAFLQGIAVNNIRKRVGSVTYTQLCNEKGGIQCDLTISRVAEDQFYLVTGTAFGPHDLSWISRQLPEGSPIRIADVTQSKGVLNLCGPNARKVLESLTFDDVSHAGFPFARCREIFIGYAKVLAVRITYVGELGWELHIPIDLLSYVYGQLWEAGKNWGMVNAGYRATESSRLEKGYRYWSSDISPDTNPYEAGLGFCVSLKKKVSFIGREALEKIKEHGVQRTLCTFTIDSPMSLFGGETILRNGEILGIVTSGGYGHTVGKTIALGYLPIEHANYEEYTITVFKEDYTAKRHDQPLVDPERRKILC